MEVVARSVNPSVWMYGSILRRIDEQKKALCNKELAYRGGTTNLREHLKSKHSQGANEYAC